MDRETFSVHDLPEPLLCNIFHFVACVKSRRAIADTCRLWCQLLKQKEAYPSDTCAVVLGVLTWARANGCDRKDPNPLQDRLCVWAAWNGHLAALQWAHENGCQVDEQTCTCAALNGHLHVLQWARAHEYPWNERFLYCAAANGHADVLKWARKVGCPWDDECIVLLKSLRDKGLHDVIPWACTAKYFMLGT